jgi:TonB family protein
MKYHEFFIIHFLFLLITSLQLDAQFYHPPEPLSQPAQIRSWLERELVYPQQALEAKLQGYVEVGFMLDKKGSGTDYKIVESAGQALDREALRLARKIRWKPATDAGQAVASKHTFTIRFNLRQYKRTVKKRGYSNLNFPFQPVDTSLKVYTFAELDKQPSPLFKDNNLSLNQYIRQQLKYPSTALTLSISGTVSLNYVIEEHGLVSNIQLINAVGGGCDNEAIRILEGIVWQPGIKNGKAVRTYGTIDITFKLPDGARQQAVPNQQQRSM